MVDKLFVFKREDKIMSCDFVLWKGESMRRKTLIQAITGFVVWFVSYSLLNIGQIERLLLFAILVIVPLVLTIVETKDRQGRRFKSYVLAISLYPVGALMAFASFFFPPGIVAGILSLGWLLWTVVVFVYGLSRLMVRGLSYLEETSIDVGLMYLLLGGGWFSLSQFGIDVMNFGALIILLTAIHFHYSAFITPIFLGLLGRVLRTNGQSQKMYQFAAIGVMVSPIGVAIGITYSRFIEFVFVVIFVACLWVYTYLVLVHLRKITNKAAFLLISGSAIILIFTMFLAFLYGLGRLLRVDFILIPDMVTLHGIGNAFGFVFVGVLGWLLLFPKAYADVYGIPFSKIVGKWKIGAHFFAKISWM